MLLAVTGSVAAYKAVQILRLFKKADYSVRVILTEGACKFITPFAFEAAGAEKVYTDADQFKMLEGSSIHLALSKWADVIIIAPASANTIAKTAAGISDNLLLTVLLASEKPTFVFPCMNGRMYDNSFTQRNLTILKEAGFFVIEPEVGPLADLESGKGRLEDPDKVFDRISTFLSHQNFFSGKKILVTAGATREYIDPVRYISNGSSGKMGSSIARKAVEMGASVTMICGDIRVEPPKVDKLVRVMTTQEMLLATKKEFKDCDLLIMAAAPADFTPVTKSSRKIPKAKDMKLQLTQTPDILKELLKVKKDQITIGFALQTEEIEKNAREKLEKKNLDIIVANKETSMGADRSTVIILDKKGNKKVIENKSKEEIALQLLLYIHDYTERYRR